MINVPSTPPPTHREETPLPQPAPEKKVRKKRKMTLNDVIDTMSSYFKQRSYAIMKHYDNMNRKKNEFYDKMTFHGLQEVTHRTMRVAITNGSNRLLIESNTNYNFDTNEEFGEMIEELCDLARSSVEIKRTYLKFFKHLENSIEIMCNIRGHAIRQRISKRTRVLTKI